MKLRDYQEDAADFIYEHDRSMVLASVGAGKTAIALTAMKAMLSDGIVSRWLVVAPKRVCTDVWPTEAVKWGDLKVTVAVGSVTHRLFAIDSPSDVLVINYDNLQWLVDQFPKLPFDGVVFDELTRLKNASGKRFKALHSLIDQIPVRVGLTGSFTSNGLEDVFGQCKIIDQTLLGRSKGAFLQQHFWNMGHGYDDWQPRPGALQQVMKRIKPATYMLENKEYKDGLPPLHQVEVRCALEDREEYERMKKDFMLRFPTATVIAANSAAVTTKLQQMSSGFVYDADRQAHWMSLHKFEALDALLDENHRDNTLIWYWYKEELAELKRRYPNAQTLDDKDAIKRWNSGAIELLLAHPMSAGHGVNLQFGGNKMVFFALPWSLELLEQAIGRLHRSGQTREVWCYMMLTEDTVDEKILAALSDKKNISDVAVESLKTS